MNIPIPLSCENNSLDQKIRDEQARVSNRWFDAKESINYCHTRIEQLENKVGALINILEQERKNSQNNNKQEQTNNA